MNQSQENHMSHRARMATAFAITMLENTLASDNAAIVPTNTVRISGAGDADVNGDYVKPEGSNSSYNGPNGHVLVTFFDAEPNGPWYLYDFFASSHYTCLRANFPFGPWVTELGTPPAPTGTYV